MGNTTLLDISLENLVGYADKLVALKEKNQSEITTKLDEINGMLDVSVGATSSELKELNSSISLLQTKLANLVDVTGTSMKNIAELFEEEDTKNTDVINGS